MRPRNPQAFTARNLPFTPRPPHSQRSRVPYSRPTTVTAGSGHPATVTSPTLQSGANTAMDAVLELCHQLMDEVRHSREENKKMSDDIRKLSQTLTKLDESYKKLRDDFKAHNETSFNIETSVYKDGLIKEAGALFAKSLTRQPSHDDIGQAIMKVLGQEGRNKFKFNKAKTFCFNRLTDLRCEERRRLFGNKPCEAFPQFTTEKFVDRMQSLIKAPTETYTKHLALLRKFAREVPDAKKETYKRFREWLNDYFSPEGPSEEDWEQIMNEDSQHNYLPGVAIDYEISGHEDEVIQQLAQ